MMISDFIENYPGFPDGVSGPDLCIAMKDQAEKFGVEILLSELKFVDLEADEKIICTNDGEFTTKTVIIATGAKPRKLHIHGENTLLGRGVSYCATCDGPFFKDKKIVVVGGGDTAVEDACYLTRFGQEVTIIHRRDKFRATKIVQERAFANPRINIMWDSVVDEISGDTAVEQLTIRNLKTGSLTALDADAVFVLIGQAPDTEFVTGQVELDEFGNIPTDADMHTNVLGVFAAGDVRKKNFRQIVTACADGAMAANSAEKYIEAME